jgi:hypothetical protein
LSDGSISVTQKDMSSLFDSLHAVNKYKKPTNLVVGHTPQNSLCELEEPRDAFMHMSSTVAADGMSETCTLLKKVRESIPVGINAAFETGLLWKLDVGMGQSFYSKKRFENMMVEYGGEELAQNYLYATLPSILRLDVTGDGSFNHSTVRALQFTNKRILSPKKNETMFMAARWYVSQEA